MSNFTENEIRLYLLGALADEPRERLEETLLTSDAGLEQLELIEEDLLDDYLTDQLDTNERALFEQHFLCTTARQNKLAYLRTVRQFATTQSAMTDNAAATDQPAAKLIPFQARQTIQPTTPGQTTSGHPTLGMPPRSKPNYPSYLKLAALLLCTALAGFLIWRFALRPATDNESIVALNRAYASGRTLDVRIGGLAYAPYAPTRGAADPATEARILRERAARILLDNIANQPTAANKHALGKYYLAEKRFDEAIEQFNAALKELPNLAELHNDLGAALLEKAKLEKRNAQSAQSGDSLQHLAAAFESIEQSLKLAPNDPAASFNKALCLQEMYLPRQAIEAWKKYLQLDPNSDWATEARRRLEQLEKAPSNISKSDDELYQDYLKDPSNDERTFDLFCQSYSTTGNGITERLIDDFLAAKQAKDETAATYKFQLLQKLGALVYQRSTDPYVRDVARYYATMTAARQGLLVKARWHLNEGRKLRSIKQSEAQQQYESALRLFQENLDECEALMTACLLGRLHLRQKNLGKSHELLAKLTYPTKAYLWLQCESLNGMAEYYDVQLFKDMAIELTQQALTIAIQLNNANQQVTNSNGLAERYSEFGNWEQAFFNQQQALEIVNQKSLTHQQHWITYIETARQLFTADFHLTAHVYQQEALQIELNFKRPLQLSRTYTYLGLLLGQQKRYDEAIQFAQEAVNIGYQKRTEQMGLEIQAYSGLFLAELLRKSGKFAAALQSYEQVVHLNKQLGIKEYDFEVYRGKALAELSLGNAKQANQDLTQALAFFESDRDRLVADRDRAAYLDKEYEAYDVAINLGYEENPQAAFDLVERGRARSLLGAMKNSFTDSSPRPSYHLPTVNNIAPLSLPAVQKQIPSGVSLIEFACLPNRLLVFVITAKGFAHIQNAISLPVFEQKVEKAMQLMAAPTLAESQQFKFAADELYKILIEPLEPFLNNAQTVCIIPDKILHRLPFAALYSVRQQRYLLENHAIITAPSATVFLLAQKKANIRQAATRQQTLAIGNPFFDSSHYAQLPNLNAAIREVQEAVSHYGQHKIFVGENATEENIKKEIKHSAIVHFAAHGIIDERSWANSRVLLTKPIATSREDGALRAYEISQMHLPRTRLAVLSACQSGIESYFRGEGMIGLSRSFLAAGVPSVVASYWAIDSEISAKLMIDFHQQLKMQSAAQALRQAQLNMLKGADQRAQHPYYWAAFSLFGANMAL